MRHNLDNLNLAELQAQRQTWLSEHKSLLEILAHAVLELGTTRRISFRDYSVVIEDALTFTAREITELFDSVKQQYMTAYQISVHSGVKQVQVAYYIFFLDPAYPDQWAANNFIVPGDWMRQARKIIDRYQSTKASQEQQDLDSERAKLLKLLLNGIDI